LATEIVCDHRRLTRYRRHDGNADASALHSMDKRAKIAVSGKQHDLVDMLGKFHRIDREFDVHATLELAATIELFFPRRVDVIFYLARRFAAAIV